MTENERLGTHYTLNEGWLCLDFANTANWHASTQPIEELTSYGAWVAWCQKEGILSELEAQWLELEAAQHPEQAERVLQRVIELREAIYRIISAVAKETSPAEADLKALNAALKSKLPHLAVAASPAGFAWEWKPSKDELDWMLGPIARSAAELLTAPALSRVGQCADNRGCGWLFLDQTRNGRRRWCSMESCGNRAKVLQHYHRKSKAEQGMSSP